MSCVVGIDPGKDGAIVVLSDNESKRCAIKMPYDSGNELDVLMIRELLLEAKPDLVVIEKSQVMPAMGRQQSPKSMYTYGLHNGLLHCIPKIMDIPYELTHPKTWKAQILKGTLKDKAAAFAFCKRRFPWVDLQPGRCKTDQDGIADAVCIAEFARRLAWEGRQ